MKIKNIKKDWVSVIEEIDCGDLSPEQEIEIFKLFAKRKILIFKNQHLNNQQLKSFCSIFGYVWDRAKERYSGLEQSNREGQHEDEFVEIVSESGILGNRHIPWHIDLTHFPSQLIPNRILYAIDLEGSPSGTRFIDTIFGLKLIEESKKEYLLGSVALCKAPYKTPWDAYVRRPALQWHPFHKDYALTADALFTVHLENNIPFETKYPDTEYLEWIQETLQEMQSDNTSYNHDWELHDLVVYDNWSTIHSRDSFSGNRKLKRVTWDQNWYKYGDPMYWD